MRTEARHERGSRRLLAGSLLALTIALASPAAGGSPASAANRAAGDSQWILLSSNRDGKTRMYSVGPDGSRLTPLLPSGRRPDPVALSRDGRAIAYSANPYGPGAIYVSRADGTGFRRVTRKGFYPEFSPDSRLLAFTTRTGIRVAGVDGRGLRRLTTRDDEYFDWSPNSKALVVSRVINEKTQRFALVVQPLRGRPACSCAPGRTTRPQRGTISPIGRPTVAGSHTSIKRTTSTRTV